MKRAGMGHQYGLGGMKMYETMRRANPEFFIHSGDQIYADGPIKARSRSTTGRLAQRDEHGQVQGRRVA